MSLVGTANYYREVRLKSLLDHEIGTHYIRALNSQRLDEYSRETIKQNRIGWQMATEEGLASLCNTVHYEKCFLMYIPAVLYYGVCLAQESSFWDTFSYLYKYTTGFEDCWVQTMRVKHGLTDTSKPGGFCKDQAYFGGSLNILENRNSIHFPALFAAKLSLETYKRCEQVLKAFAASDHYTCPPQIKGAENLNYFKYILDEIHKAHQEVFLRHTKLSPATICNNPIRPPLTFFGETLPTDFLIEANRLLQSC